MAQRLIVVRHTPEFPSEQWAWVWEGRWVDIGEAPDVPRLWLFRGESRVLVEGTDRSEAGQVYPGTDAVAEVWVIREIAKGGVDGT
jgi:hypothetical protein